MTALRSPSLAAPSHRPLENRDAILQLGFAPGAGPSAELPSNSAARVIGAALAAGLLGGLGSSASLARGVA